MAGDTVTVGRAADPEVDGVSDREVGDSSENGWVGGDSNRYPRHRHHLPPHPAGRVLPGFDGANSECDEGAPVGSLLLWVEEGDSDVGVGGRVGVVSRVGGDVPVGTGGGASSGSRP